MKRHLFATLFGLIALTAISANAKSLEEAARDFVAGDFSTYFGQPVTYIWVIRYEVGTATVSDRYPFAIAQNLVPRETTIYPIRIHWWAKDWGLRRSDFFLFQDSFGTWKHFYADRARLGPYANRRSSGPLLLTATSVSESENDALVTEDQRRMLSVTFLYLLLPPTAKGQTSYAITDIRSILGSYGSYASSINNRGQVVGSAYAVIDNLSAPYAFLFSDGQVVHLGTLGGVSFSASGINNRGQIVGAADITGTSPSHAFLYSDGQMLDLGTLGGPFSYAEGINDLGKIVGYAGIRDDSTYHALL
jgi:probable HAF family extracellular repeat protein